MVDTRNRTHENSLEIKTEQLNMNAEKKKPQKAELQLVDEVWFKF